MPKVLPNEDYKNEELTSALRVWAKRKNIKPIDMTVAMGWSYNYTWAVLRGSGHFSNEAFGKFIKVYGLTALVEIFKIAKINPEPEPNGNH